MINLNATSRYLMIIAYTSIYNIYMTAEAVKPLEHKLSTWIRMQQKVGKQSCVVSNFFRHVEHLFEYTLHSF